MFDEFREKRFAPPPLLKRMVQAGLHGRRRARASTTTRRSRPGRWPGWSEDRDGLPEPARRDPRRRRVVTINRPDKLNALNDRTVDELDAAFAALGADAGVRGVILTGAGREGVRGRRRHRGARHAEPGGRAGALDPRPEGPGPHRAPGQAGDRGHQRVRPGRRLRAGHGLPRARRLRERAAWARRRSSSGSCAATAGRSGCRGWWARAARWRCCSPGRWWTPRKPCASAS